MQQLQWCAPKLAPVYGMAAGATVTAGRRCSQSALSAAARVPPAARTMGSCCCHAACCCRWRLWWSVERRGAPEESRGLRVAINWRPSVSQTSPPGSNRLSSQLRLPNHPTAVLASDQTPDWLVCDQRERGWFRSQEAARRIPRAQKP